MLLLMIEKKHIGSFSVRWSELTEPIRRVNLPSDHPAFVDEKKASGRQRWGLYFEKWRLLEGSVVTLGADPAALIGRMQEAEGDVRTYWRKAINHALEETHHVGELKGVQLANGEIIYVESTAWEAMLEEANRRCSIALDALEDANATYRLAHDLASQSVGDPEVWADAIVQKIRSEDEQARAREDSEETAAQEPKEAATLPVIESPVEVARMIRKGLEQAACEVATEARDGIRAIRGKVT